MGVEEIRAELLRLGNAERAHVHERYFKAYPGGYGQGDRFLGVGMPPLRSLAKKLQGAGLGDVRLLLCSKVHEERMLALLILIGLFERADEKGQEEIFGLYTANMRFVNNWDLVDASAPAIVGGYLLERGKGLLYDLASSASLWERRIAILATFRFIRENSFEHTLSIARLLVNDPEDLIHKALGWMLREVGKRDMGVERSFLDEHADRMPRTMLRYAIERFPEEVRQGYLKKPGKPSAARTSRLCRKG